MKSVLFVLSTLFSISAFATEVVEFHIIHGTGKDAWNTEGTIVQTKVGQILRIVNDDDVIHRLHTNGAPCSHGPEIAVRKSWDCKLSKTYSEAANGKIYDHISNAGFYLVTTAN